VRETVSSDHRVVLVSHQPNTIDTIE